MTARLRRLKADHDLVRSVFSDNQHIRLIEASGDPPDKYVFQFNVSGLIPHGEAGFVAGREHKAEIFLPLDYPRRPPFCRMITPVFHPNIDPQKICIGDHWSAGQTLALMVTRIAEMICFQSYNVKSPLNAAAAAWAEKNIEQLPLEKRDISTGASTTHAGDPPAQSPASGDSGSAPPA